MEHEAVENESTKCWHVVRLVTRTREENKRRKQEKRTANSFLNSFAA